jgi:signal transduction histidine kinase
VEIRLRPADVLVPGAILALGALELAIARPDGWEYGVALEAVSAALVVGRRFHPLVLGTPAAAILLWMPWVGPQLDDVATPILMLALVCYSFARWTVDLRGLACIGLLGLIFLGDYLFADARDHDVTDVVFVSALLLPPYIFGRITRKLAEQSEQLERQQEQIRDQAARAERDRIARELHDVIAHSLSAMVVQTAAAQDLVRASPERAAALLQAVADTGRRALDETGRLLHLIRDDADELGLRPVPGLADVPDLVARFRDSGLELEAELRLPDEPLAGGVDVSAYRLVQETLTNALKYADGPVRLSVLTTPERVRIRSSNRVGRAALEGAGLGLQGMAERVAMLGGTLHSGPTPDAGFLVDAEIPLAGRLVP